MGDFQMPEKFHGKSAEEIAQAYVELERLSGKQAHELGEMRKLSDQLLKERPKEKSYTKDDFTEDKIRHTIQSMVAEAVAPAIEGVTRVRDETSRDKLQTAHPDYADLTRDPAFQDWVKASKARTAMWVAATDGEIDYAIELFDTYKQLNAEGARQKREELAAATATTRGGSRDSANKGKKTYSRIELMKMLQ